jgi:hypothetical protein
MISDGLIPSQNPHVYWHSGFFVVSRHFAERHAIPLKKYSRPGELFTGSALIQFRAA